MTCDRNRPDKLHEYPGVDESILAAEELIGEPLDLTFLRLALSPRTGRVPRLVRAGHCVYAAQLAELVLSGHLVDIQGSPQMAVRHEWPTRLVHLHDELSRATRDSWDELFWAHPEIIGAARKLATAELIDRGLWRKPSRSRLLPKALLGYQQFYPGEGKRMAALLDLDAWVPHQFRSMRELRGTTLIALLGIFRGNDVRPLLAQVCLDDDTLAANDELTRHFQSIRSLLLGTEIALVVATGRWAAPEFAHTTFR